MLSPAERKKLNTEFFTALGLMMQGNFAASGRKIKWTNYKTGIKNVFVRLHADSQGAWMSVDLQHSDEGMRDLYWEQLEEMRGLLNGTFSTELIWFREFQLPDGRKISRISTDVAKGNIHDKSTWPDMLTWLKKNLIEFDEFWNDAFDIFKALED